MKLYGPFSGFLISLLYLSCRITLNSADTGGYKYEVEVEPLSGSERDQVGDDLPQEGTWTGFQSDPVAVLGNAAPTPVDLLGKCHDELDLAILLDASYSITTTGWEGIATATKDLIDKLDISPAGTHVSLMKFSTDVETFYMFDNQATKDRLKSLIDKMEYDGEWSRTDIALNAAKNHIFVPSTGARGDAPKAIVLFTDGKTDGPTPIDRNIDWVASLIKPLQDLRDANVTIFCVASGNHPDYSQINWLAGDRARVFTTGDMDALVGSLGRASKKVCPYITGSGTPLPSSPVSPLPSPVPSVAPTPSQTYCTSTPASCTPTTTCYLQVPTCILIPPVNPCTPVTTTCEKTISVTKTQTLPPDTCTLTTTSMSTCTVPGPCVTTTCIKTKDVTTTKVLPPQTCTVTTTKLATCTPSQTCYPNVPACVLIPATTPCVATTTTCFKETSVTKTEFIRPTVTCTETTTKVVTCTPTANCYPPGAASCVNLFIVQACNTITSTVSCPKDVSSTETVSVTSAPTATLTSAPTATVTPTASNAFTETTTVTSTTTITVLPQPTSASSSITPSSTPATGTATIATATYSVPPSVAPTAKKRQDIASPVQPSPSWVMVPSGSVMKTTVTVWETKFVTASNIAWSTISSPLPMTTVFVTTTVAPSSSSAEPVSASTDPASAPAAPSADEKEKEEKKKEKRSVSPFMKKVIPSFIKRWVGIQY
ncbi:mucin-2 [Nematostella vectensis]|uniref:mucin-2 n=1 Tax=Nematostella vectensis TaxID=45351 RepID=UPI0020771520|nr:mucin-2 [Nematostella vectensis]